MKKSLLRYLGAAALALGLVGSAQAVLLSELLGGQSITAGDKLFDSWSVIFQDSSIGREVDTTNIDVSALNDGDLNPGPGLRFDILNGEFSVTGDDIYAYVDFTFGFRVSVLDPTLQIKDNSLSLTDAILRHPSANHDLGIFIKEYIGTTGPIDPLVNIADLGEKEAEFSRLDDNGDGIADTDELTANLTDSAAFAPQGEIWVTKNILVWASNVDDVATLTGFEQRFSQTSVPEPASLALLSLGLVGLGFARRRRS